MAGVPEREDVKECEGRRRGWDVSDHISLETRPQPGVEKASTTWGGSLASRSVTEITGLPP